MEDYKQKYEEAVKEISKLRDMLLEEGVIYIGGIIDDNFKRIFPELKESEDERIRKDLIKYFELHQADLYFGSKVNRIIAWLKRQGEKHIDRELSKLLNRVICRFINDPNIPYSERDEVSKKIIPYVEQLEKQDQR